MEAAKISKSCRDGCESVIVHLRTELGKIRTGRASTGLLESLMVDYYGSQVNIQQMGLINAPESRLLTIQVYDSAAVDSVEKAIRDSSLGLNPSRDGSLIRVPVPALTDERRKELVKTLKKCGEDAKVAVRAIRRDAIDGVKKSEKSKEIGADVSRRNQEEIQKLIDGFIKQIDDIVIVKENEILDV